MTDFNFKESKNKEPYPADKVDFNDGLYIFFTEANLNKMEEIVIKMNFDEVVEIENAEERNKLLDYMNINDIDPNDYRSSGKSIWLA
jgi:hypothetical protein